MRPANRWSARLAAVAGERIIIASLVAVPAERKDSSSSLCRTAAVVWRRMPRMAWSLKLKNTRRAGLVHLRRVPAQEGLRAASERLYGEQRNYGRTYELKIRPKRANAPRRAVG